MADDDRVAILRHFVAALAYRASKALRGAPPEFSAYRAAPQVRTPRELVRHMSGVLSYAAGLLTTTRGLIQDLDRYDDEVSRLFELTRELDAILSRRPALSRRETERLLQGPLSDAMTHVGQLTLLRRLCGSPIPPEDFFDAAIEVGRTGLDQSPPVSPDAEWPEAPASWSPTPPESRDT